MVESRPKWSILILTQETRQSYLRRLLDILEPQVAIHPDVEIKIRQCDYLIPVGDNRQIMRQEADGEYSNFIDDDDLVPDNYVVSLLPLMDGPDFIGHKVTRYDNDDFTATVSHSLAFGGSEDPFHSTPHINPIKTEIALQASMSGGFGEDNRWWNTLKSQNAVKTEAFLPEVMYTYWYRSNKSDGVQ